MHYVRFLLLGWWFCSVQAQDLTYMKRPDSLKPGDTVAIVSTARKNLEDNLTPTYELLCQWGLNVKVGHTIGLDHYQLAGTDAQRTADFQDMLDDPNIKAIWCVRGGYGTVRIIDHLDFTQFLINPKWIIGFSDVTVLHSHLNRLGVASLHALMPVSVPRATASAKESLRQALFGEPLTYTLDCDALNHGGKAQGELVGGNLSILYSLLGSPSAIDCKGKILFIEDLDEYLYHLDRMMLNLKRNGCLANLKGLVVGGMTKMNDNDIPWGQNALEIIEENIHGLSIPVIYNFPAGHIQDNRALIMGSQVEIEVTATQSSLRFLTD